MNIILVLQVLQVIILIPWVLYVWIKDSRFGSQPECNHFVKYVFFFVTVRATVGWLRILAFAILAACAVGLVVVLVMALKLQKHIEDVFRRESQASAENPSGPLGFVSDALYGVSHGLRSASDGLAGVPLVGSVVGLYSTAAGASITTVKAFSKLFPDPKWEKRIKRVGRVFWVFSILAAIYGVVTMELIVHRNHPIILKDSSENEWAFGQIASIILILPIVIDVLAVWFKRDEPPDTAGGSSSTRPSEKQG
ncbi:hypothetical protein EDB84DRAFT_315065 [Lactarius hengduanensis]|nr:hypothetical protein EDB84DRAFT_315065 [Lactarius hengduanensis]